MKLSATDVIAERRARLKQLRHARSAATSTAGGKLVVNTWYHGEQVNFCDLLSLGRIKSQLASLLDHEIAETVRQLEAHGIEVDE